MSIGRHTPFRAHLHRESAWYAPIAALLARLDVHGRFPAPDELSALHREWVECGQGLPPLRFVEAPRNKPRRIKGQPIDPRTLYEGRVVERGEVPTRRDDWHDLFNALAFMTFPRAKRALHARQYELLKARLAPAATRLPNARTREQDALSLLDEGGLVVGTTADRVPALQGADDDALAAAMAHGSVLVVPFGHALYEHMVAGAPCPLATAHIVALEPHALRPDALPELDRALASALAAPDQVLEPSPARGNSLAALSEKLATLRVHGAAGG